MSYRFTYLLVFGLLLSLNLSAQVVINTNPANSITSVVNNLAGNGVKISNISWYFPADAVLQPWGQFTDNNNAIGLSKGLLLTTGAAVYARGPNNDSEKSQQNGDNYEDPDLKGLVDPSIDIMDVAYVEFDIVSSSPVLSFNYVFGSEEYMEYVNENYNDIFGFFISGPGITGKKNLALIPNTGISVGVTTLNENSYSQYYRDNGTGYTPSIHKNLQYDGYTVVLNASIEIIPCQTYRIKLAIADAKDDKVDSGVFIEQGSFRSEDAPQVRIEYEHIRFPFGLEECNDANIIFKRPLSSTTDTTKLTYKLTIGGSAQNGIDYSTLNDTVIIPKFEDSVVVNIHPLADLLEEGTETIIINIESQCPNFPAVKTFEVPIRDRFDFPLSPEKICKGQGIELNENSTGRDSMFWENNPYLSCTDCPSPIATLPFTEYINYTVKDTASGCLAIDSVLVTVYDLKADFAYHSEQCYTSLDIFFDNKSQNAHNYTWDFGDNTTSSEVSPQHYYPFNNTQQPVQYVVTLTVSRDDPSCVADTSFTIAILEPLYTPNLITPDGNRKNDYFHIIGISNQCWTLVLYNKWGAIVYKNEKYDNTFNGDDVAEGVYFYELYNSQQDRNYKGWLEIRSKYAD
ncbi:MAG: choice-of-anchor L domain-containing protein [Cytophagaceae bacterium]|nr:choice-of-anchor L domain-containing protein [Cytophagaceae bacterium]